MYKVMPTAYDNWCHQGQWWAKVRFSMAKYLVSVLSEMSCRQCCIWRCSNRNGRCPNVAM